MNIWHSVLVSLFLLTCVAGLIRSHRRTWRRARQSELEAEEFDYRRRQFRRRMQTSAMLGVLAVALPLGDLLANWVESNIFQAVYWGGVLLLVVWLGLLVLADVIATKYHFGRLRHAYLLEQAKLLVELRRAQVARGNGKARKQDPGQDPKPPASD